MTRSLAEILTGSYSSPEFATSIQVPRDAFAAPPSTFIVSGSKRTATQYTRENIQRGIQEGFKRINTMDRHGGHRRAAAGHAPLRFKKPSYKRIDRSEECAERGCQLVEWGCWELLTKAIVISSSGGAWIHQTPGALDFGLRSSGKVRGTRGST